MVYLVFFVYMDKENLKKGYIGKLDDIKIYKKDKPMFTTTVRSLKDVNRAFKERWLK